MKKRAMKKWIPKHTPYCDNCKWFHHLDKTYLHRNPENAPFMKECFEKCEEADNCKAECWSGGRTNCTYDVYRCDYLGITDKHEDTLLWDGCKECGISVDFK